MKRSIMIALLLTLSIVVVGNAVYAYGPWGHGMGYGTDVNVDNMKNFLKETLSLRDELITKRFEVQNEYNKPKPDYNRIATLKKEMVDIQTKVQAIADKYELPFQSGGFGMGCGKMRGRGMGFCCTTPQ